MWIAENYDVMVDGISNVQLHVDTASQRAKKSAAAPDALAEAKGQKADFEKKRSALEALYKAAIQRHLGWQDLDRARVAEATVCGAVNRPPAAAAEQLLQFIRAQDTSSESVHASSFC